MVIVGYCNKTNFSSSINGVIRPVLNFLFFFTIRFHKYKKAQKEYKVPKSTKKYKNTTNLRFINLRFIDLRFINLRFIDLRFIKLKKHLSGKK